MSEYIGEMITKIDFDKITNIIESSMDDSLYVLDLQADTYRISPSALERYLIGY